MRSSCLRDLLFELIRSRGPPLIAINSGCAVAKKRRRY